VNDDLDLAWPVCKLNGRSLTAGSQQPK